MEHAWKTILAQYGQRVTVYPDGEGTGVTLNAFLQPVLDQGKEQTVPSPLGMKRQDRFLYLGPASRPLTPRLSRVTWAGQNFEVQAAQPVGGKRTHHWWAVLRLQDREET